MSSCTQTCQNFLIWSLDEALDTQEWSFASKAYLREDIKVNIYLFH